MNFWKYRNIHDLSQHRDRQAAGKPTKLDDLLGQYRQAGCHDPRDRVFALLSLASDCAGLERSLVDYTIERPLLFFAILAVLKPSNPSKFSAILQDALRVRRRELVDVWEKLSQGTYRGHRGQNSSLLQMEAERYIRQVVAYGSTSFLQQDIQYLTDAGTESDDSALSFPSRVPSFIVRSFLAQNYKDSESKKDPALSKWGGFVIEHLDIAILQKPTLFGYVFAGVAQWTSKGWKHMERSQDQNHVKKASNCWYYSKVFLEEDGEGIWSDGDLAEAKDIVIKKAGEDVFAGLKGTELSLALIAINHQLELCITDCRYLITMVYNLKMATSLSVWSED